MKNMNEEQYAEVCASYALIEDNNPHFDPIDRDLIIGIVLGIAALAAYAYIMLFMW